MEGEREGEKHGSVASRKPQTRGLTHNPGMCPDWELNQQPFGSQANAQSTGPHQPELTRDIFKTKFQGVSPKQLILKTSVARN